MNWSHPISSTWAFPASGPPPRLSTIGSTGSRVGLEGRQPLPGGQGGDARAGSWSHAVALVGDHARRRHSGETAGVGLVDGLEAPRWQRGDGWAGARHHRAARVAAGRPARVPMVPRVHSTSVLAWTALRRPPLGSLSRWLQTQQSVVFATPPADHDLSGRSGAARWVVRGPARSRSRQRFVDESCGSDEFHGGVLSPR
jgi:hypothetical protein